MIISIEHGIFEVLQGNIPTNGLIFNAIPPSEYWIEGNERALSLIPNFLITGIFALIIGILVIFWTLKFVDKNNGAIIFLLLQICQLLLGGGIAFFILGILVGLVAFQINKPLNTKNGFLSGKFGLTIAKTWKFFLIISIIIFSLTLLGAIIGVPFLEPEVAKKFLMTSGAFSLFLMIYTFFAGFASDIHQRIKNE